ncbi:MAG: hypothetical protein CMM07_28830 [Rhodopirellula sp.]|nr:hypothetical protein [Rhodopirellula sp.]
MHFQLEFGATLILIPPHHSISPIKQADIVNTAQIQPQLSYIQCNLRKNDREQRGSVNKPLYC